MTREGKAGNMVFIVRKGSLRVYKEMKLKIKGMDKKITISVPLNQIQEGSFIGEEILYQPGEKKYLYTVKVESFECKLFGYEVSSSTKDYSSSYLARSLEANFLKKEKSRHILYEKTAKRDPEKLLNIHDPKTNHQTSRQASIGMTIVI